MKWKFLTLRKWVVNTHRGHWVWRTEILGSCPLHYQRYRRSLRSMTWSHNMIWTQDTGHWAHLVTLDMVRLSPDTLMLVPGLQENGWLCWNDVFVYNELDTWSRELNTIETKSFLNFKFDHATFRNYNKKSLHKNLTKFKNNHRAIFKQKTIK